MSIYRKCILQPLSLFVRCLPPAISPIHPQHNHCFLGIMQQILSDVDKSVDQRIYRSTEYIVLCNSKALF